MTTLVENLELKAFKHNLFPSKEKILTLEISLLIDKASDILPLVWPLKTFIASNPLHGLESLPFEEALAKGSQFYNSIAPCDELEAVNRELIKWCQAFLDEGQATLKLPGKEKGFYSAWRALAPFDKHLHKHVKETKKWLFNLPSQPEEAILICFEKLKIDIDNREDYLRYALAQLPGWGGYIKRQNNSEINLVNFLAVRLAMTCALCPESRTPFFNPHHFSQENQQQLDTLKKREEHYLKNILKKIHQEIEPQPLEGIEAQWVFCIDVRSEPLRDKIEKQGNYETFGFAGFFGVPVRIHHYNNNEVSDACPVLIKPHHDIYEQPLKMDLSKVSRHQKGKALLRMFKTVYNNLKYNFATPFALVETLGIWCGVWMLFKTLAPKSFALSKKLLLQKVMPSIATKPLIQVTPTSLRHGIALTEQTIYAETALRMMGLIKNFSLLIILCGHRSSSENNPYASSLDCGACGGNHGGSNAKILAEILNTPEVRDLLKKRNLMIPEETVFIAAEHNTTTDEVILYEQEVKSPRHVHLLHTLKNDLKKIKDGNQARLSDLSGIGSSKLIRHSCDWAETRPESGLARNAAFISGSRALTKNVDLEGRCFLHSYDWKEDADGKFLETILTAPMVVAEWINTQYLFSTLDNIAHGSGSKITHNITGKLGIMQGNASDLMHGLPLQSVKSDDETLYHIPQRLQVIVHAPREKIDAIIQRQPILQTLFYNGWVILIAIEPEDKNFYLLNRNKKWNQL